MCEFVATGFAISFDLDNETISAYIGYLEGAFLFEGAARFNIKGNKYFDSIKKYYAVDVA